VSAENYLSEPIPEGSARNLEVELVKELLKESRANIKVLEVLSRNSDNFQKIKALLKSIADS
jgi:hypothetical protein